MFERFSDRARRVVVFAQEEARRLGHDYIGTEHFLLGLLREGEGVGCRALESLGVELEAARRQIEAVIGQGSSPPSGHIPFTPRAKKVLDLSLREALQLGHNHIGTEHILLGLLREGEGVACQVLVALGADLNRARQQVITIMSGEGPTPWVGALPPTGLRTETRRIEFIASRPDPARMPLCPNCQSSLADSLRFRTLSSTEQSGEGRGRLLVAYCESCGVTIDTTILPENP